MKTDALSAFASQHQRAAAGLIILSEFTNAAIGITVGSSLLARQPGWYLAALLTGLIAVRVVLCRYVELRLPDLVSGPRFRFQKHSYFSLFFINFLAYTVAGGISGRTVLHPEPSVSVASERSVTYRETKDSLTLAALPNQTSVVPTADGNPQTGTKIGYILLFLASLALSYGASGLACRLACSNQGFLAVFVLLLATGILAGGLYFLGRALTKNMKPYREMTKDERKREGRRYFRTLLGTVAVFAVSFLLGAIL
ncbi:hypothetical protein GCM10027299_45520 [Larkinella ripae]